MSSYSANTRILPLVIAWPMFLQHLDTSVMATALPSIANDLRTPVLDLNLAITAYLLSLAVFLPISGWLAERWGARRMFCLAILLFTAGSALCGTAHSLPELVAYRLLQGVGGAMMMPVGRLILLRSVPASRMVNAMVWFTVPSAFGRMIGPLVGGAVVTVASWRWIFLINIPIGLLGIALALWFIEKDQVDDSKEKPALDLVGFALLAVGLIGLLGGLQSTGNVLLHWSVSVTLLCTGILSIWAYLRHVGICAEPLIDLRILRYPTFRATVLGGMPMRVAIGASPFLLPLMFQLGFGLSPLQSGLLTMAAAIGSLCTRTILAHVIRAVGFRPLLIYSTLFTGIFYATYGLFSPDTPHLLMFAAMLGGGLCNSLAMVTLNTLGFSEIPRERMSHATATSTMAQQLSLSLGVVLGASLLTVISALHGGGSPELQARDFSPAFVAIGALTLVSMFSFTRLRADEGDELRGR